MLLIFKSYRESLCIGPHALFPRQSLSDCKTIQFGNQATRDIHGVILFLMNVSSVFTCTIMLPTVHTWSPGASRFMVPSIPGKIGALSK